MTAPVPSDIDGPAGEAGDLIERCEKIAALANPDEHSDLTPELAIKTITALKAVVGQAASALAAYQARAEKAEKLGVTLAIKSETNEHRAKTAEAKVAALTAEIEALKAERDEAKAGKAKWYEEWGKMVRAGYDMKARAEASAAALRTDAIAAIETLKSQYLPGGVSDPKTILNRAIDAIRAALPAKGEG